VIKEGARSGKVRVQPSINLNGSGSLQQPLVSSSYFAVEKYELQSTQHFTGGAGKSSVQILVATNGSATLNAQGCDPIQFGKGDAVVVPASIPAFEVLPDGSVQFLKSSVPGMPVSDPEIMNS
jgi:mannose-6-phosphate isomerase class I